MSERKGNNSTPNHLLDVSNNRSIKNELSWVVPTFLRKKLENISFGGGNNYSSSKDGDSSNSNQLSTVTCKVENEYDVPENLHQ
jgi:hypothetical protein